MPIESRFRTFFDNPKKFIKVYPINPLSINPKKMVKHTQIIRWQRPTNCLSVFDHFVVLALKELTTILYTNKKLFTTQNCALTHTYLKSIC